MSGRDLLGLPLAALAVFTGAKSFRDNPVLGSRWLNKHGLHVMRLKHNGKLSLSHLALFSNQ